MAHSFLFPIVDMFSKDVRATSYVPLLIPTTSTRAWIGLYFKKQGHRVLLRPVLLITGFPSIRVVAYSRAVTEPGSR